MKHGIQLGKIILYFKPSNMKLTYIISTTVIIAIGTALFYENKPTHSEDKLVVENNKDNKQEVSALLTPDQLWEQQHASTSQQVESNLTISPELISAPELGELLPDEPISLEEQLDMDTFIEAKESSSVTLNTLDESQDPDLYYVEEPELEPLPDGLTPEEIQALADQKNQKVTASSFDNETPGEYPEEMKDSLEALDNLEEMHSDRDVNITKSTSFMPHDDELEPIAPDSDLYIDPLENETQVENLNNFDANPLESPIIGNSELHDELSAD